MAEKIIIPQMGESVVEISIGNIIAPTGSYVEENAEIIEIETEKVNQVLYASTSGIVSWSVEEGQTLSVGSGIGTIEPSEAPLEAKKVPKQEVKAKPTPTEESARLMPEAFLAEIQEPAPQPLPPIAQEIPPALETVVTSPKETRRKMSKIRKVIASRLVDALHNSAMLTTFNEVDMSTIMDMRSKYQESFIEEHQVKLGFMSFFVKAVVQGLKAFPDFNSYIENDEIVTRHNYDVGIAVSSERGLVVPVVRACDQLSYAEIERAIRQYGSRAQDGTLSLDDLRGGGFTITNGGVFGSLLSTPILNPPQVGILGMHKIMKRPVVVNDEIVIRPMMYLALSYDHRMVDGKEAVTFLVHLKEILEDPSRLMFIDIDGEHG